MTQTTAERIAAILRQELERAYSVEIGYGGIMGIPAASVRIAYEVVSRTEQDAEIYRLTAERDVLTAERDEARAEVERLRPAADLGGAYMAYMDEDNDAPEFLDALETAMFRACKDAEARAAKVVP